MGSASSSSPHIDEKTELNFSRHARCSHLHTVLSSEKINDDPIRRKCSFGEKVVWHAVAPTHAKARPTAHPCLQRDRTGLPIFQDEKKIAGSSSFDSADSKHGFEVKARRTSCVEFAEKSNKSLSAIVLHRGGVYVAASSGSPVQFGSPPETLKDCLSLGLAIPEIFIVPPVMFNRYTGLSLYEFEFPCYFNYFVRGTKVTIVTDNATKVRIEGMLQESLCGPLKYEMEKEFTLDTQHLMPDLEWENRKLRDKGLTVDCLVNFVLFEKTNVLSFGVDEADGLASQKQWVARPNEVVEIRRRLADDGMGNKKQDATRSATATSSSSSSSPCASSVRGRAAADLALNNSEEADGPFVYEVYDAGAVHSTTPVAVLPELNGMALVPPQERLEVDQLRSFSPPQFAITVLGASHGFDPNGKTAGFIIWTNGFGTLVDPPPNTVNEFRNGHLIPPGRINGLILTHCHADHDCGIFQELLGEGRMRLYTTRTIMRSFVRKYACLMDWEEGFLASLFEPIEVFPHVPVGVNGAELTMFYSWHTIPCAGFSVKFGGKSFVYSADHCNDAERISAIWREDMTTERLDMAGEDVRHQGRRDFLTSFPFEEHDLIFHELGVPPVHTPGEALMKLPEELREKIYCIHVAEKDLPAGLKRAMPGLSNTLVLVKPCIDPVPNGTPTLASEMKKQLFLESILFLRNLDPWQAARIQQIARLERFSAGAEIVAQGEMCPDFFVVTEGWVQHTKRRSIFQRLEVARSNDKDVADIYDEIVRCMISVPIGCDRAGLSELGRFERALELMRIGALRDHCELAKKVAAKSNLIEWLKKGGEFSEFGKAKVDDQLVRYALTGSFFNEGALLGAESESSESLVSKVTTHAVTEVEVLKINRWMWMPIARSNKKISRYLRAVWEEMEEVAVFARMNQLFASLTSSQMMAIAARARLEICQQNESHTLHFRREDNCDGAILLLQGTLKVTLTLSKHKAGSSLALSTRKLLSKRFSNRAVTVERGSLVVASQHLFSADHIGGDARDAITATASEVECRFLVLSQRSLEEIFRLFPGLLVAIADNIVIT